MRTMTYAAAIAEALAEEMERDPEVFLIGEDIGEAGGVFGVTKGLQARFGAERVLDTPISEEAIAGAAVGAALLGGRPVAEIMFSDFATLAMDMIVNQAAKTHYMTGGRLTAPVTLRLVTGTAGATAAQHSQSLEAWFTHTPGLKCVAPSTPADAKALTKAAIRDPDPVCVFEHKQLYFSKSDVPDEVEPLPLGVARIAREGTDVTVVAYLKTLHEALAAAAALEKRGSRSRCSIRAAWCRSIAPRSARRSRRRVAFWSRTRRRSGVGSARRSPRSLPASASTCSARRSPACAARTRRCRTRPSSSDS